MSMNTDSVTPTGGKQPKEEFPNTPWLSEGGLSGAPISITYFPTLFRFFSINTFKMKINNQIYRHSYSKYSKLLFKKCFREKQSSSV